MAGVALFSEEVGFVAACVSWCEILFGVISDLGRFEDFSGLS